MNEANLNIDRAGVSDLSLIAALIRSAVEAWPAPAMLKRNVLPVLAYDEQDLADHEILLVSELGRPVAPGKHRRKSAGSGISRAPRAS